MELSGKSKGPIIILLSMGVFGEDQLAAAEKPASELELKLQSGPYQHIGSPSGLRNQPPLPLSVSCSI